MIHFPSSDSIIGLDKADCNLYRYLLDSINPTSDNAPAKFCMSHTSNWLCRSNQCSGIYPSMQIWAAETATVYSALESSLHH